METIGTRIKNLRKDRKFTQQQLADHIGVSKTSVIYWEKDETIPKHESLLLLSQKLGVDSNYIMYGQKTIQSQSQTKQFQYQTQTIQDSTLLSPEVEKLICLLKTLDKEKKLSKEVIQHLKNTLDIVIKAK